MPGRRLKRNRERKFLFVIDNACVERTKLLLLLYKCWSQVCFRTSLNEQKIWIASSSWFLSCQLKRLFSVIDFNFDFDFFPFTILLLFFTSKSDGPASCHFRFGRLGPVLSIVLASPLYYWMPIHFNLVQRYKCIVMDIILGAVT